MPETVIATTDEELREASRRFDRYFARAAFSRGGVSLLTNTGPARRDDGDRRLPPDAEAPWLVQQFVDGETFCTYSTVHDGKVTAHLHVPDPAPVAPLHRDLLRVDRRRGVAAADRADPRRARLHGPGLVRLHRHRRRAQLRRVQPAGHRRAPAAAVRRAGARAARPRCRPLPAPRRAHGPARPRGARPRASPTTCAGCRRRFAISPGSATPATAGTTRCRPSTRRSRSPISATRARTSTRSSSSPWPAT